LDADWYKGLREGGYFAADTHTRQLIGYILWAGMCITEKGMAQIATITALESRVRFRLRIAEKVGLAKVVQARTGGQMAQVDINDIVEYQVFRRNPGPLLARAAEGRPLLLLKGRTRFVIVDAESYNSLVQKAADGEHPAPDAEDAGMEEGAA
jgi:hypothetical protein